MTDFAALYEQAAQQYAQGRVDDAARLLEQAITAKHDFASAHLLLGQIQQRRGELEDAADCYALASAFAPDCAEPHIRLGALSLEQGRADEALERFERALAADPRSADAHSNLGYVLLRHFENVIEGARHVEAALEIDPHHQDALCNRVMALQYQGRLAEALALSEALLAHAPDEQLRLNRSLMLLSLGDFARGWDEYEARKRVEPGGDRRPSAWPEWNGEPLAGKTILVRAEQGLGDQVMFASCVPDVCASAQRCIIESDPRLTPLFARSFAQAHCYDAREGAADWLQQGFVPDCAVSMGSLPRFFRRDISAFPRHAGYLRADPARIERWQAKLAELPGAMKVGVSWRGGVRSSRRTLRSIDIEQWLPVLRVPAVEFVSLQYGDCREELEHLGRTHGIRIHHWQDAIYDYDETAALACALDMVISVQTAAVHLAGALGQTTWALIAAIPEWRYLASGEAMPWYPSVRLIRQRKLDDWAPVLEQVAHELASLARAR